MTTPCWWTDDGASLRTPYFVVDEGLLERNLEILQEVARARRRQDPAGPEGLLHVLRCYPLIAQYLAGSTASGLYEARLGKEHFPGEVHVFSPAYREEEFEAAASVRRPLCV